MKYYFAKELEDKTLRLGDNVILGGVDHFVTSSQFALFGALYLQSIPGNVRISYIFDFLKIFNMNDFCEKYYGYAPYYSRGFPNTKTNNEEDCQALTRLAIALMRLSEFKTVKDAIDECACVKEHIKTSSLILMAEELEKLIEGKDLNSRLDYDEVQMVRKLFNAAEDQINQK